jgi:hypothetical protein
MTRSAMPATSSSLRRVYVGGDHPDHREDPAGQVRAAGRRVVVGGVVQRLHQRRHAALGVEVLAVELLQRPAGEQRSGADRVEGGLLVAAPGDVVGEDPALLLDQVVAGEEGYDGQPLHRHPEVRPDQRREPVGLAVHGQRRALDLLVVLELGLEQPHHLHRETGRTGDPDRGILVGGEHLLDVALGDDVAHRGAPVPGHHHTAGERGGDDGGAVRGQVGGAAVGQRPACRQQLGGLLGDELRERRRAGP